MGTRGTVSVFDGDEEILRFYAQCDGYPEGLGKDVADFCATKRVVNGISSNHRRNAIANGAGCLAALLLAHFKEGVGHIYVTAPNGEIPQWSYHYKVRCPSFDMVDKAKEAATDWRSFDGLPIVVEAFDHVEGGEWKRIPIPDDEADENESPSVSDPGGSDGR